MLKGIKSMNDKEVNQKNKNTKQSDMMKGQQFFREDGFPGPQQPRREGEPLTAPPDFTPQLPRMEGRQMERGNEFGPRADFRQRTEFAPRVEFYPGFQRGYVRPRELRSCVNRFTYLWLINGNSFWFYPIFVGRYQIEGFRWRRGGWMYDRINIRRIYYFRCF